MLAALVKSGLSGLRAVDTLRDLGVCATDNLLDVAFPRAAHGSRCILEQPHDTVRADPPGLEDASLVGAVREIHRCARHCHEIFALPEICIQTREMPEDRALRQLTIVNYGEVPRCRDTCALKWKRRLAGSEVGAAETVLPRSCSNGSISLWLVSNLVQIGSCIARVVGPEGLEPPTKAL